LFADADADAGARFDGAVMVMLDLIVMWL